MPTIRITDQLGVDFDVDVAPASSLLKDAQELPGMVLQGASVDRLKFLTLNDPAIRSLTPTLHFEKPVGLGAASLTLHAEAGITFAVITDELFSPDEYGDNIAIPAGQCYVALGVQAGVGAGVSGAAGALQLGMDAGTEIAIVSYRCFSTRPEDAPTVLEALRVCLSEFVFPGDAEDLVSLASESIVTITGRGTLKFSADANLLAIANPLATVALPSPVPAISVQQTASVTVGASWTTSTEYQVRAHKLATGRVHLGWYRKRASDATVTASASAGISAGFGDTDLFPTIVGAISSDAHADLDELERAGLPDDKAADIAEAVKAAVNRKLQLGVEAEFGASAGSKSAFLYEIDPTALDTPGAAAVGRALHGNLGALTGAAALPAGVAEIRSILTDSNARSFGLKLNLLGIFNFGSISRLAIEGAVVYTPSTGELVIADKASAERIRSAAVNFGADDDKLRRVIAESVLITAAYRGSNTVVSPPSLSTSQLFFRLDANTSRTDLRRYAAIARALGLPDAELPPGFTDFGRTTVCAEASYDDALSRALFLQPNGEPRPHEDYERAGLLALAMLIPVDADDAYRRDPALHPELWARMKKLGQPGFRQIFDTDLKAAVVSADYSAIQWWADAMTATAAILAPMVKHNAAPHDPAFQQARDDLARHLRTVAANAHEQFGDPWGLVAMYKLSEKSRTELQITGPRFVYRASRAIGAAAAAVERGS